MQACGTVVVGQRDTDDPLGPDAGRGRRFCIAQTLATRHPRLTLRELAEPHFETWVQESFKLAVSTAYRKGKIKSGIDKDHGASLPRGYHAAAQHIAERRLVLSGYRLADFLRSNFP